MNWISGAMDLPSEDHTVYDNTSTVGHVVAKCGYCPGVARTREDELPPAIKHDDDCPAGRRWCPAEYLADDGGDDPDQLAEALARHRY